MVWERKVLPDVKSLLTGNKSRNKHVFWSMVRWGRWWQQSKTQKKDKHIGLVHGLNEILTLTGRQRWASARPTATSPAFASWSIYRRWLSVRLDVCWHLPVCFSVLTLLCLTANAWPCTSAAVISRESNNLELIRKSTTCETTSFTHRWLSDTVLRISCWLV